jgi:pilus assembly protein Flp/PilA
MKNLLQDESGQGLVEYALIVALISLAALAVLTTLGKHVANTLSDASTKLS